MSNIMTYPRGWKNSLGDSIFSIQYSKFLKDIEELADISLNSIRLYRKTY